ncbi:MAG: FtsQ-type POTRA domain-containing protein [Firmicutes bacterium]|nr:FtsQ-type POTRA domain-containing protein [Bacillota bacterium]
MGYVSKTTSDGRLVRVKDYKKRIRRNRLKRKILFFTFLLFCFALFLHLAPIFNIKEISCDTGEIVSKDEIITASGIGYDFNIFRTNIKKAAKKVEDIAYVRKAVIKRKFPNVVKISVSECKAFGNLPLGEGYVYIDEECKMLEYSSIRKEGLPLILNTGIITFEAGKKLQSDGEGKNKALKELFKTLTDTDLIGIITTVDILSDDMLTLFYNDALEILVGKAEDLDYKMGFAIKTIVEKLGDNPRGYLDVSNPKYGFVYRERK